MYSKNQLVRIHASYTYIICDDASISMNGW